MVRPQPGMYLASKDPEHFFVVKLEPCVEGPPGDGRYWPAIIVAGDSWVYGKTNLKRIIKSDFIIPENDVLEFFRELTTIEFNLYVKTQWIL